MTTGTTTTTSNTGGTAGGTSGDSKSTGTETTKGAETKGADAKTTSTGASSSVIDEALKAGGDEAGKGADGKTADEKKGEGEKGGEKKPIELKLPDGFKADAKELDGFKALAGELELDSTKAQKLFDFDVAREQARNTAAEAKWQKQDKAWRAAVESDPELGGAKFATTQLEVRGALKFLGKEFGNLLQRAGLGNHPDAIRALAKIGRANADDSISGASGGAAGASKAKPKSDAEIF
jgi:hypothetical protein